MKSNKSIGIVLPAYNEGEVIGSVIADIPSSIDINNIKCEVRVVVVNDGSSDNTAQEVKKFKKVYLINHILNSGAGAATRTGLHFAYDQGCDYVVTMDSDGQHAIEDVKKLIDTILKGDADFVIGSRLINSEGMPWYRVLGNKGLSLFTFLMFGVFVTDSQSGLKALNRKAISQINFHSNNFAFCSEMLWHAKKAKLKIKEVPIKAIYSDYSLAKGQTNWDVVHIIRQMVRQRIAGFFNG
jgi:glycosyltransferase involved in cell wall biosynthesis